MDNNSSQEVEDRISKLPDDVLLDCLSLLDMKNAAETSIISRRWRYLWTHLSTLDFDPEFMYPEECETFWNNEGYETRKYFTWINQVINVHQGTSIDKFKIHSRYVTSFASEVDKWVKFALSKRVKELVLELMGNNLICKDHSEKGYPFGFHTLRHPICYTGITTIQSLHLCYVDVSKEFLEYLLCRCHHLERLYLESTPISSLRVKSSTLKHLSIIMRFFDIEELEIDAENLLYFLYDDAKIEGSPRMVFKHFPKLVEISFRGGFSYYPYPIFEKLSLISTQLRKLSLQLEVGSTRYDYNIRIPDGVIPIFPNVKHLTCTTYCYDRSCILSVKHLIEACPILEEFKLQAIFLFSQKSREAPELQKINLENEEHSEDVLELGQLANTNEEKPSHPNLRIMEVVGFLGTRCDVQFALAVVSYAPSLYTIICDPRGDRYTGTASLIYLEFNEYDIAKSRARKLAKIVSPKVKVVTI